jgi:hypothetical protein
MAKEKNATETTTATGNRRIGSDRPDNSIVEERIHTLYKMRAQGHDRQSCRRFAKDPGGWGVSESTFERYWRATVALLRETWSIEREEIFFDVLAGLREAQQMATEQRNPSAAQACLTSIARLTAVDPSVPWARLYEGQTGIRGPRSI